MESIKQLNALSREQYHDIWERTNAGTLLDEEEKVIGELMKQHKEFYKDWDSTDFDYEYDIDTEVNPFMHIALDSIVVNQINGNNPKQSRFTYNKLRARGDSHLDAIHKIASVVLENLWEIMKYRKEFNEKKYIKQLKRIT
ncbi:hypothetical protein MNBD_IGNAVI01-2198 [hydrothermal vent metagenome]|uniref:Uncharacterized protein n=1 Tax=hydrothermal vent metagenome TaxID=652676 RepID=A0A3B1BTZ8_9ZZZZ